MIIDGHAHACGGYLNAESIKIKIDQTGVDKVVLVPGQLNSSKTYKLKDYTKKDPHKDVVKRTNKIIRFGITLLRVHKTIPKGNEHVYSLAKALPDNVIQFFWVTKAQVGEIDAKYMEMIFKGLKLHQCWEYFKVDSNYFKTVANWATRNDMPLFIHLYSYKDVADLIEYLKHNQNIKLINGHLFGLELFMKEDIDILNNVYFDVSNNCFISNERFEKALKHFSSKKLLMGSDIPYGEKSLERVISRIKGLGISKDKREEILGNNMKRLLSI
ncbi:MAG: TatD family hydrolase [Thermoplasmata archaeon]|nr:MAG: TatD family hydrolase [Thermoplasmata archaeon]